MGAGVLQGTVWNRGSGKWQCDPGVRGCKPAGDRMVQGTECTLGPEEMGAKVCVLTQELDSWWGWGMLLDRWGWGEASWAQADPVVSPRCPQPCRRKGMGSAPAWMKV